MACHVINQFLQTRCDRFITRVEGQFRILRRFIRRTDTGELKQLARMRFPVQTFRVSCLARREVGCDMNFVKHLADRITCTRTVLAVRGNKRGDLIEFLSQQK